MVLEITTIVMVIPTTINDGRKFDDKHLLRTYK